MKPKPTRVELAPIGVYIGTPLNMPDGTRWIFNLTLARELIAKSVYRDRVSFGGQELARLLAGPWIGANYGLAADKVMAADPDLPGIAAVIEYGGQRTLQIIEGPERACNALRLNKPFTLDVLTDLERDRCLWSRTGIEGIADNLRGDG